jgi:hypothetical protein
MGGIHLLERARVTQKPGEPMNWQAVLETKKLPSPTRSGALMRHTSVRPIPDQATQPTERIAFPANGHDFSRLPVTTTGNTESLSTCSMSPRRCPFGGACHTCPVRVQPKLTISQPDDEYEHEAERMADMMTQVTQPANEEIGHSTRHQGTPSVTPLISNTPRSSGQPLDANTRSFMAARFGHDFSQVRVHTDAKAAESVRAVNALAYTVGSDIVFGTGQYAPSNIKGLRLIAHELTHVVQQGQRPGFVQRKPADEKSEAMGNPRSKIDILEQAKFFLLNPDLAEGALRTELRELQTTYRPQVNLAQVEFRSMTSESQEDVQGYTGLATCGQAHWEKNAPVIELAPCALADFEKYESATDVNRHYAHNFIRTIGHEMYHLYRAKMKHAGNPLQPLFEQEYRRRMEQVRQNWVNDLKVKRPTIKKWQDIPKQERETIEKEAANTGPFEGTYLNTAYLVEEIYTKIEELGYLRIEQRFESGVGKATQEEVSVLADLVFKLWNRLASLAGSHGEFMTPQLLAQVKANMEIYIQKRYGKGKKEPYELHFFRSATQHGHPPLH